MEDSLVQSYLALLYEKRFSPATLGRLLSYFGTLQQIRTQSPSTLAEHGLQKDQIATIKESKLPLKFGKICIKTLKWAENPKNQLIVFESSNYPSLLRQISVPPPVLFVQGECHGLASPAIAIVGSRRCSSYGSRNARWMGFELARCGLSICSGLAKGIDAQAHRGALQASGQTIAVVATGLDQVYPPAHKSLAREILEQGILISEFPLGTAPRQENFPRRNRIISGLSIGVLVVEANLRSGSLITARQALEQNREVFVIPGSISSEQSKGCHHLIKQGGKLVESPAEILEDFPQLSELASKGLAEESQELIKEQASTQTLNDKQQLILKAIGSDQVLLDHLLAETSLPMAKLASELMTLEIEGIITVKGGRYFKQ